MGPQLLVDWIIKGQPPNSGTHMDNLFVRWGRPKWMYALNSNAPAAGDVHPGGQAPPRVPALVLGPDFLPGGALEGESSVAPCTGGASLDCPQQVPAVEDEQEYAASAFVGGECSAYGGVKHRLSFPSAS